METEYSKATEYGNYLSMDNQAFPVDCETLAALQNIAKKIAALGWIAGYNKLILTGCNVAGLERKEGYVFVVNSDNPLTGEILYYKGGSSSSEKCHISEKTVNVTADGTDFLKAYSIRTLEDGVAGEPMNWADFGNVNEISNLKLFNSIKKEVSDINSAISSAISTEVTNRNSAISSAISTEVTNRDKAISSAVSAEATNRDKAISSAISAEVTNRDKAISNAVSNSSVAFFKGMILLWVGRFDTIPSGWVICDEDKIVNGVHVPDLTYMFVMGATKNHTVLDYNDRYGGKSSILIEEDNLPRLSTNVEVYCPTDTLGNPDDAEGTTPTKDQGNYKRRYWRGWNTTQRTVSFGKTPSYQKTINITPPCFYMAYIIYVGTN